MDRPIRILLIDDDEVDRLAVQRALRRSGLPVELVEAVDGESGLRAIRAAAFDAVLLDYRLPDREGDAMLRELQSDAETPVPIIMLTAVDDEALALQLLERGAVDYLSKTEVGPSLLKRSICYALARQQVLHAEVAENRRVTRLAEDKSKLSAELAETNAILEKRNQRLSELADAAHQFVDNVSHEFRTPLTVIKEFASILEDGLAGEVSAQQRELLDIILQRVGDLNIMVDDMLDTSRLEAGLLGMTREACRIEATIAHVGPTLQSRARERNATLEINVDDDLPAVWCDAEKIGRVIVNLVLNAFKFSGDTGAVELWVRDRPDQQEIVVGITDHGHGIEPENLQMIFERFNQIGGVVRGSTRGFGLGLSIAKELVQLNLGDITVESEPGRGSTFMFTVPAAETRNLITRLAGAIGQRSQGDTQVSLIAAEVEATTAAGFDDAYRFLQQEVRSTDLLFRIGPNRCLIVAPGGHKCARDMLERLAQARVNLNRYRLNGVLPVIASEVIGTWPLPGGTPALIERFEAEHPSTAAFAPVAAPGLQADAI